MCSSITPSSLCIRLHCASLSVVLVFEAEQSYSQYRFMRCGRIMCIERIYLLGNRPSSELLRTESIAHAFCLLPTEPVTLNPSKRQWCQAPTQVSHVLWVWCWNYCRLIVQLKLSCVCSTTPYSCSEKVKAWPNSWPMNSNGLLENWLGGRLRNRLGQL